MIDRNPIIYLGNGAALKTIGDAHFGRVFKTNVPLDRRGEYEALQLRTLKEHLHMDIPVDAAGTLTDLIRCHVGDWFDKSVVANRDVLNSYSLLKDYERDHIEPLYIISGNHDDSKSITEPTSWDVLAQFFMDSKRVIFVKKWKVHQLDDGTQILFVGWNIHDSVASAYLEAVEAGFNQIRMVVCHLDRISYGDDTNVIPYDFLVNKGIEYVVSGHEHKPYRFRENDMQVIGTGSLLPYSHAEDPEAEHYITIKGFEDVRDYFGSKGEEFFRNKHVRVYIEEEDMDEFLALNLDCLSLQVNKAETMAMEDAVTEVVVESYDAKTIWRQSVAETGLDAESAALLWAEIEMKGIENE